MFQRVLQDLVMPIALHLKLYQIVALNQIWIELTFFLISSYYETFRVIRRLLTLIAAHGVLEAKCHAAMKQADSASKAAENLLANQKEGTDVAAAKTISKLESTIEEKDKGKFI